MRARALAPLRPSVVVFVFLLVLLSSRTVFAGPPFLTDDPEPVSWRHYEAYLFSTVDRGPGMSSWTVPAFVHVANPLA
jgi:hypothetical protein